MQVPMLKGVSVPRRSELSGPWPGRRCVDPGRSFVIRYRTARPGAAPAFAPPIRSRAT